MDAFTANRCFVQLFFFFFCAPLGCVLEYVYKLEDTCCWRCLLNNDEEIESDTLLYDILFVVHI